MKVQNIETPALILDAGIFRKNIAAMDEILRGTSLRLRPHYKSHKCASIALLQMRNGAKGMTCAKLSEACDLADAGVEDILIANQITDGKKIRRLASLAGDCRLTVCVDDKENIKALSLAAKEAGNTIFCLVEYDIGMERCGVTTKEEALSLAKEIEARGGLVFEGIQAYAGHISHVVDAKKREEMTRANYEKLRELKAYFEENNMPINILSGGSTGTAQIKAREGLYNELQAGSYLFMDSTYSELDVPFENALFLLSTVVSSRRGLTVLDAGVKTCGVEQGMPKIPGNNAREVVASEEHFQFHGLEKSLSVGEKVKLIPGHCCSTVNLHDKIYVVEGDKVVDRIPVTARGIGR